MARWDFSAMIKNKLNTSFGWTTVIFGEIDSFFFCSAGDPVAIRAVGSLNNRSLNRFQLRLVLLLSLVVSGGVTTGSFLPN